MISRKKSRGNALTEFAVLGIVMVPAVLVIPNIGKMSDLSQSTIQASRYAVWERTVSDRSDKSDQQLEIEVRNRFYGEEDLLFRSDRGVLEGEDHENQFWQSVHSGLQESENFLDREQVNVVTRNTSIPGDTGADVFSEGIGALGGAVDGMISNANWDLEEQGFYVAEISTEISSNRYLSEGQNCAGEETEGATCLRKHYAMFVDEWDSSSPRQTERRVRALVPAGMLEPMGDVLALAGNLIMFQELGHIEGMFGQVQVDVLPLDRYGEEE